MMNPSPSEPIPIYIGGLSEIAFRRAARHDGWVGDIYTVEEASRHAARLHEIRAETGAYGYFSIITALSDAFLPEHFDRRRGGRDHRDLDDALGLLPRGRRHPGAEAGRHGALRRRPDRRPSAGSDPCLPRSGADMP